jgi:hypothetical protein
MVVITQRSMGYYGIKSALHKKPSFQFVSQLGFVDTWSPVECSVFRVPRPSDSELLTTLREIVKTKE